MEQKHIPSKKLKGHVSLNKNTLADLADLIRLSPTACRILFLLSAHADNNNSVITDVRTISALIGESEKRVISSISSLVRNGYVEMKEVKLNHSEDMMGVVHDKNLYYKSRKNVWKVIGEKFVTTYKLKGTYNRFYINNNVVRCHGGKCNSILKNIRGNLFYDSRIRNDEILWEM